MSLLITIRKGRKASLSIKVRNVVSGTRIFNENARGSDKHLGDLYLLFAQGEIRDQHHKVHYIFFGQC